MTLPPLARRLRPAQAFPLLVALGTAAGAAPSPARAQAAPARPASAAPPSPDPRVGLRAGLHDAGTASWNMRLLSTTPPPERFRGSINSDRAFTGRYAIQGSFNGFQVWDLSEPRRPVLAAAYYCPALQSDVSVYKHLLFVSAEGNSGRLDCGDQGVRDTVSAERLRGLRIFDITDVRAPKYVGNVQTCRGSHTHTVLADPRDTANVYVLGSADVRPASELAGCVGEAPTKNANSALFRIEVVKVPLAAPQTAAIVSSPRIVNDLTAPPRHGEAPEERRPAAGPPACVPASLSPPVRPAAATPSGAAVQRSAAPALTCPTGGPPSPSRPRMKW